MIAPITGRFGGTDEIVLADWQAAGLAKASVVKPLLATFDKRLIRRHLGRLSPADLAAVRTLFARVLEIG